jgi:hypothetical protein
MPWQTLATGFFSAKKVPRDPDEVGVVADVFRGPATAEEDAEIVFGHDLREGDIGPDLVALPLLTGHHRLEASLLELAVRIQRIASRQLSR